MNDAINAKMHLQSLLGKMSRGEDVQAGQPPEPGGLPPGAPPVMPLSPGAGPALGAPPAGGVGPLDDPAMDPGAAQEPVEPDPMEEALKDPTQQQVWRGEGGYTYKYLPPKKEGDRPVIEMRRDDSDDVERVAQGDPRGIFDSIMREKAKLASGRFPPSRPSEVAPEPNPRERFDPAEYGLMGADPAGGSAFRVPGLER